MADMREKIKKFKTLRISDLESPSVIEVWVLNLTNPRGDVAFNVRGTDGGSPLAVKLPITYIPVCLTSEVPKTMLLNSVAFRKALVGNKVRAISAEDAKTLFKEPDYQREYARITENADPIDYSGDEFGEENAPPAPKSVMVLDLLGREEADSLKEQEVLDVLYSNEEALVQEDYHYIVTTSKHPKVKKWAASKLQQSDVEEE
jgi:hypothetical protein